LTLFCLIHGSAQHAGVWALLTPELRRRGHATVAVHLPGDEPESGAGRYAQVVAESLEGADEDVIAVAHSASGLFLPLVAELRPVRRLIFLAGVIPRLGASFTDQLRAEADVMFDPDWIGQDPSTDAEAALRFLFHDCEPDVARWGLTTRSSWYPEGLYAEVCPLRSWPKVPSSYIVCADDRTIRPEWSRQAARSALGVEAIELPGGHCPHVSRPEQLADVLSTLAATD
jgi:pimeloyl-ACP methyl ester carboxylesterase